MNKWYKTIIVNHKEEEGKLSHWLDDENYKILCEERVEQLNEIEKLQNIIKEVREYITSHREAVDEREHIIYFLKDDFDEEDILEILDKENK